MTDMRQVLQEAKKALDWYCAEAAAIACNLKGMPIEDKAHTIEASLTVLSLDAGLRAAAASDPVPAASAPPAEAETTVTEAMVDAAVTEWRSWCRAMPPTFVDNHPRDGIRQAIQAAINAKEQA